MDQFDTPKNGFVGAQISPGAAISASTKTEARWFSGRPPWMSSIGVTLLP